MRSTFRNNIICNLGEGTYSWGESKEHVFESNCFSGNHPESEPDDRWKITSDPLFIAAGRGGQGRTTVDGYQLQAGSPCRDSGRPVEGHGGRDYSGGKLYQNKPDRGAFEH